MNDTEGQVDIRVIPDEDLWSMSKEFDDDFGAFVQRETSMAMGRASLPLLLLFLVSLVQGLRYGFGPSGHGLLAISTVISLAAMFFYGLVSVLRASGKPKQPWMFLAVIGGFVPYLYSLYVTGYFGFWSLTALSSGWSFQPILKAGFYILLGSWFLRQFFRLTELCRKTDSVLGVGDTVLATVEAKTPSDAMLRHRTELRDEPGSKPSRLNVTNVRCWSCKHEIPVTESNRGTQVRCEKCGTRQELPR